MEPLQEVQMAKLGCQIHGVVLAVFEAIREPMGKLVRHNALCGKPLNSLQLAQSHCLDNSVAGVAIPLVNTQPLSY